jgi:hypothetical protein
MFPSGGRISMFNSGHFSLRDFIFTGISLSTWPPVDIKRGRKERLKIPL